MNTRKKGKEVSNYFIEINKELLMYKDLFIKKILKEN
jgi:phage anti-repressor protein